MVPEVVLDIEPSGDSALLVHARGGDREARWTAVTELRDRLTADPFDGYRDLVSTFEHLFVSYDCLRTDHETAAAWLTRLRALPGPPQGLRLPRLFVVPAVFGDEYGPDLLEVADRAGLSETAVVDALLGTDHLIRFVGAAMEPMTSLDGRLGTVPRRRVPRPRVPAGSVSLASLDLAVYPFDSPGGWQIVGRTPLRLCGVHRDPPAPYEPGDRVRFERLDPARWDELAGADLHAHGDSSERAAPTGAGT